MAAVFSFELVVSNSLALLDLMRIIFGATLSNDLIASDLPRDIYSFYRANVVGSSCSGKFYDGEIDRQ
jgi:hypothetical protein